LFQLGDLPLLFADRSRGLRRDTISVTPVDLGLANPFTQRFGGHPQPGRDRLHRGPLAVVVATMVDDQPDSFGLGRFVVLRRHDLPILPKKEGGHQTRGASQDDPEWVVWRSQVEDAAAALFTDTLLRVPADWMTPVGKPVGPMPVGVDVYSDEMVDD